MRRRGSARVLYVGHSHTDRLWKTMLRHVQAPDSFERVGDWVFRGDARELEVSIWVTHRDDAEAVEGELIERLEPTENQRGVPADDESDVPF